MLYSVFLFLEQWATIIPFPQPILRFMKQQYCDTQQHSQTHIKIHRWKLQFCLWQLQKASRSSILLFLHLFIHLSLHSPVIHSSILSFRKMRDATAVAAAVPLINDERRRKNSCSLIFFSYFWYICTYLFFRHFHLSIKQTYKKKEKRKEIFIFLPSFFLSSTVSAPVKKRADNSIWGFVVFTFF